MEINMKYAIAINHFTDWDCIDRIPNDSVKIKTVLLRDRIKYLYLIIELAKKYSGIPIEDLYFVIVDNSNWCVTDLIQKLNIELLNGKAIIVNTRLEQEQAKLYYEPFRRQYGDALMSLRGAEMCRNIGIDYVYRINARYVPLKKDFFIDAVKRMQNSNKIIELIPWKYLKKMDIYSIVNPCYFPYHISAIEIFKMAEEIIRTSNCSIDMAFARYWRQNKDKVNLVNNVDFSMWNDFGTWFDGPHENVYYIDEILQLCLKLELLTQKEVDNISNYMYKPTVRIGKYYYRPEHYFPYPYDFKKEKGWDLDPVFARYE